MAECGNIYSGGNLREYSTGSGRDKLRQGSRKSTKEDLKKQKIPQEKEDKEMTNEAKKDIAKLIALIAMKGISKIGQKKVQKTLEAIMIKHNLTEDELMDEYDRQFSEVVNA